MTSSFLMKALAAASFAMIIPPALAATVESRASVHVVNGTVVEASTSGNGTARIEVNGRVIESTGGSGNAQNRIRIQTNDANAGNTSSIDVRSLRTERSGYCRSMDSATDRAACLREMRLYLRRGIDEFQKQYQEWMTAFMSRIRTAVRGVWNTGRTSNAAWSQNTSINGRWIRTGNGGLEWRTD